MIDAELLDDASAALAWLRSFEGTVMADAAEYARTTVQRLLHELQAGA